MAESMGEIRTHAPVLLVMAAFSRHDAALDWAEGMAVQHWGPAALTSPRFAHEETRFYERTMGTGLFKTFFAFERLIDPATLADLKHQTNGWEKSYRRPAGAAEHRPLNLDPGYLTEAKLILASTKDRDHRIYLGGGIFAEGTLIFQRGEWRTRPWTYPDYQRADYHEFFTRCRDYLRRCYGHKQ
ncbi:MAG: DUF4416 family protein [Pirellulaceae bacterium]